MAFCLAKSPFGLFSGLSLVAEILVWLVVGGFIHTYIYTYIYIYAYHCISIFVILCHKHCRIRLVGWLVCLCVCLLVGSFVVAWISATAGRV